MNHPSWGYKLWTQEEVEALVGGAQSAAQAGK